jgi:hypothetical protein
MNGRALSEKAIEVSPSSSRVLDRAAEILTPFPPSKNRPRPGDWNCPSCGFSNFQRRTACFRCSFPAAGANHDPYGYGHQPYGNQHHSYGNNYHGGHGGGHGGHHGRGNGPVPFRAGDWRCGAEGCSYHNFAKNVNCLRCGAPRSGAAVVVDQSFPSPMGPPPDFGMGHPGSMASTPGPASFGPGAQAFGSGAAFAQPPPQTYGMPSAMGPPGAGFPHMGGMTPGYAPSHMAQHSFGPAAQAAFSGATDVNPLVAPPPQNGFYGNDPGADPFAFLSSGMQAMGVSDENQSPLPNQNARRNGGPQSAKSPA